MPTREQFSRCSPSPTSLYSWLESWIQGQILFKKKKILGAETLLVQWHSPGFSPREDRQRLQDWADNEAFLPVEMPITFLRRILILFSARTLHMVTWIILLYTFYKNIQSTNTHSPLSGASEPQILLFPHKSGAVKDIYRQMRPCLLLYKHLKWSWREEQNLPN